MQYNKFIKALTLLGFALLIISFLLYRTGKLDGLLYGQTPTHTNAVQKDTMAPPIDSARHLFIPSSKSIVLTDKNAGFLDAIVKKSGAKPAFKSKREVLMMSSSKSGIIIPLANGPHFNWDSLHLDSLKTHTQKRQ
jgi:hypothetical protein